MVHSTLSININTMKPYIITHMAISVDGRIDADRWGDKINGIDEYERTGELLGDAWMVGRVTMEKHFASHDKPQLKSSGPALDRSDFVAPFEAGKFAVAIDASGKLFYDSPYIEEDHIIAVLTEKTSDVYLQYLKDLGISYVFGGVDEIDFHIVVDKLNRLFNIKKLLLEGGGGINGSMLKAGLVDEISVLQFPLVDGRMNTPALFDINEPTHSPSTLQLISAERLPHDILWLRYKVGT